MSDPGKLTRLRCRALLGRLLALLDESMGQLLLSVALYGSVARDEGGSTSDLDVLIVHRGSSPSMPDLFTQVLRDLRQTPEYRLLQEQGFIPDPSPIFFTAAHLAEHPWLLLDVLDHGIILLDRGEVLQRALQRLRGRLHALGARKVVLPDGTWYWDLKPDWKPGEVVEL